MYVFFKKYCTYYININNYFICLSFEFFLIWMILADSENFLTGSLYKSILSTKIDIKDANHEILYEDINATMKASIKNCGFDYENGRTLLLVTLPGVVRYLLASPLLKQCRFEKLNTGMPYWNKSFLLVPHFNRLPPLLLPEPCLPLFFFPSYWCLIWPEHFSFQVIICLWARCVQC